MKKIINLVIIILCSLVFTSCSNNLTKTTYEKPYNFNLKVTDGENEWVFTYDERRYYIEYDYITPGKKYYPIKYQLLDGIHNDVWLDLDDTFWILTKTYYTALDGTKLDIMDGSTSKRGSYMIIFTPAANSIWKWKTVFELIVTIK